MAALRALARGAIEALDLLLKILAIAARHILLVVSVSILDADRAGQDLVVSDFASLLAGILDGAVDMPNRLITIGDYEELGWGRGWCSVAVAHG